MPVVDVTAAKLYFAEKDWAPAAKAADTKAMLSIDLIMIKNVLIYCKVTKNIGFLQYAGI